MSKYVIIFVLPPLYWYEKGVVSMDPFTSFIVAVMAGIVACCICKWLDSGD